MLKNDLNAFNVGGRHEQNPNGGIPQGQGFNGNINTVEQGETKKNNFVYSDRITLTPDVISKFNLPKSLSGKTAADASKVLSKKFEGRNDRISTSTKSNMLDRVAEAQEEIKAKQEQLAKAQAANSAQVPDMMNGAIPKGMEEYTEPINNSQEESQEQMRYGGNINKFSDGGVDGYTNGNTPIEDGSSTSSGYGSKAMGALSGGYSLFNMANGNASSNQGSALATGALTGAAAGSVFGPVGTVIGAGVGLIAGSVGSSKKRKEEANEANISGLRMNNAFSDHYKYGGKMNSFAKGGYYDDPTDPPFKKDIVGSADYNTNIVKNFQKALGVTADGIWGKKSNQAYFNDRIKRDPEYAAAAKKMNYTTEYRSNSDFTTNNISDDSQKRYGLTPQGYKFNGPETPNALELIKQNEPFVEPTGVLAGMEKNYQNNLNKSNQKDNSKPSWLSENYGEVMRYAPIAMNLNQLNKLKKPQYESLNKINDSYKPQYVDESNLVNMANMEMNNTNTAIQNMGGSEGANRNAILASGLNRNKALAEAYINAKQANAGQYAIGKQYNLGVANTNLNQSNSELDINDRNIGNYDTQRSKLLGEIGTNIGDVGKEEVYKKMAKTMFGYTYNGKYWIKPDGTRSSDSEVVDEMKTKEKENKTNKSALGGYLLNKKRY